MDFLRVLLSGLFVVLLGAPTMLRAETVAFIDIAIDQARVIRLESDAAQIIVGNPSIADVAAQSARLLVITGKSYGSTNLIALDSGGREIFSARLGVREEDSRQVTLYKGTARQSYHCAPNCQPVLAIGDDKTQFEQLAETVSKKFGVANSAIGGR